jgi:hypothetical protein
MTWGCSPKTPASSPSPVETSVSSSSSGSTLESSRAKGQLTACKSNLKNIGTALEMYSTDFSGKYPPAEDGKGFNMLVPNYLREIPACPAAGSVTYVYQGSKFELNVPKYTDYYFFQCTGNNHEGADVTGDFPAYDGISGVIETQVEYDAALAERKAQAEENQ